MATSSQALAPPFGAWIRHERTLRDLSQAECARRAGIDPQGWYRLETAAVNPGFKSLGYVSRAFGISLIEVAAFAGIELQPLADNDLLLIRLKRILEPVPPEHRLRFANHIENLVQAIVDAAYP